MGNIHFRRGLALCRNRLRKVPALPEGADAKAIARRAKEKAKAVAGYIDPAAVKQAGKEFMKAGSFYRSVLFHNPHNAFASNGLATVLAQQDKLQVHLSFFDVCLFPYLRMHDPSTNYFLTNNFSSVTGGKRGADASAGKFLVLCAANGFGA